MVPWFVSMMVDEYVFLYILLVCKDSISDLLLKKTQKARTGHGIATYREEERQKEGQSVVDNGTDFLLSLIVTKEQSLAETQGEHCLAQ